MTRTSAPGRERPAKKLDPNATYRDAMKSLIAARWADVWKAVPVALAGDDIEGVHDVRVASRRLRAAMDVAVECFPAAWYRPLHRTAKEITAALGEVRDRDVLLQILVAERDHVTAAERPGITRLIDRIEVERVAARAEMEAYLHRLMSGGVPAEVVDRFGSAATPPASTATDGGDQEGDQ